MIRTLLDYLLLMVAGAGSIAVMWKPALWPIGLLIGLLVAHLFQQQRIGRLLRWLSADDPLAQSTPPLTGLWGQIAERVNRLLKRQVALTQRSDALLADFLSAIQASPNGVMLLDAQGRIEWMNLTAAGLLQIDPVRDVGQYVRNLLRAPAFGQYWTAGDFSKEVQFESVSQDVTRPLQLSLQLHPYGDAKRLLLVRDVTALKRAEAMRRDFVANVSHEIRTPLTVLIGFVETLQTLPLDELDKARYLEMMHEQALRMQYLVDDLLTLSRLEASPEVGVGHPVSSQLLSVQSIRQAQGLSQTLKSPAQTITDISTVSLELWGVTGELTSALSNLLTNAVRYSPPGSSITVRWSVTELGGAVCDVSDSGPGVAPEHLNRLTERFYRVDASRSQETGGTGLGLAIVKHVMVRHGGELSIQSVLGKGSTFTLGFPAARVKQVQLVLSAESV